MLGIPFCLEIEHCYCYKAYTRVFTVLRGLPKTNVIYSLCRSKETRNKKEPTRKREGGSLSTHVKDTTLFRLIMISHKSLTWFSCVGFSFLVELVFGHVGF